jgi:hypothetical protein
MLFFFHGCLFDECSVVNTNFNIAHVFKLHEERLHQHENVEAIQLLDNTGIVRRLQRKKLYDLV